MHSRREFLNYTALLSGVSGLWSALSVSIGNALAIEPDPGSTYLDAKHIVVLMQENRSFDHCFGSLQGVRGFNDPRAIELANGDPVWVQTDARGNSYAPFRLQLKESKSTWMGSLPHSWASQVDARQNGKYDRWLDAKRSGDPDYARIPLTLGYYDRSDLPFYYSLADAFTICDHYFCSSLTPTTPNRLHLWTGTVREKPSIESQANVSNENVDYPRLATWATFPERLEDLGVSWKVYQNEMGFDSGLGEESYAWLANFSDNPLEYFQQYQYGFAKNYRQQLESLAKSLPVQIEQLRQAVSSQDSHPSASGPDLTVRLRKLTAELERVESERSRWSNKNFEKLSERQRSLHRKAFTTNEGDPYYRQLMDFAYRDGDHERRLRIPRGDVLWQFRKDVESGSLPAVSWLVAPERFSDHPSSPWYGAWYIAETINILIANPDIWKKTIFILTYDENDGFFDHVPPFVPPHPHRAEAGLTSPGLDAHLEYVELEQDRRREPAGEPRESPIGLGYRVPTIIASPWTRGGNVCSQVFDHTSVLQLMEKILSHRLGKPVVETNISAWRRAVCGDLTSAFHSAPAAPGAHLGFPPKDQFLREIDRTKLNPIPSGYHPLTRAQIDQFRSDRGNASWMPRQEPGVRPLCPSPYELHVHGSLDRDRTQFRIAFEAAKRRFGVKAAGCPFIVYAFTAPGEMSIRNYAVAAGDRLEDAWSLRDFADGRYRIRVYGPNGFFREFTGSRDDPGLRLQFQPMPAEKEGKPPLPCAELRATNNHHSSCILHWTDRSYHTPSQRLVVDAAKSASFAIDARPSAGWYDFSIRTECNTSFEQRFAGHIETGERSLTDPSMGRSVR